MLILNEQSVAFSTLKILRLLFGIFVLDTSDIILLRMDATLVGMSIVANFLLEQQNCPYITPLLIMHVKSEDGI